MFSPWLLDKLTQQGVQYCCFSPDETWLASFCLLFCGDIIGCLASFTGCFRHAAAAPAHRIEEKEPIRRQFRSEAKEWRESAAIGATTARKKKRESLKFGLRAGCAPGLTELSGPLKRRSQLQRPMRSRTESSSLGVWLYRRRPLLSRASGSAGRQYFLFIDWCLQRGWRACRANPRLRGFLSS